MDIKSQEHQATAKSEDLPDQSEVVVVVALVLAAAPAAAVADAAVAAVVEVVVLVDLFGICKDRQ